MVVTRACGDQDLDWWGNASLRSRYLGQALVLTRSQPQGPRQRTVPTIPQGRGEPEEFEEEEEAFVAHICTNWR